MCNQFLRYKYHTKPVIVLSIGMAATAPIFAFVVAPLRKKYLFPDASQLPLAYPCEYFYNGVRRGLTANKYPTDREIKTSRGLRMKSR